MLTLNKAQIKTGEELYVRFCHIKYLPSGAISALLNKKANTRLLIPWNLCLIIQVVKLVDPKVVGVKVLKYWQQLKVYGMPLKR